jgi:hypothetical protein
MKTAFEIKLDPSVLPVFFPNYRIKNKLQILEILLESARYIIHGKRENKISGYNKLIFFREKMNRIFFIGENKMYSIIFPFNLQIENSTLSLNYKNLIEIDSLTISNLIILLKSPLINSDNCFDFIEPVTELEDYYKQNYWPIFKDLLIQEDGYVRYDKDEIGFLEAKKNEKELKHPLYHLDIFYSNGVSFKIGLNNSINGNELIDTLNLNSNCKFLKD